MHVDDIILAKRTSIERCIAQIESYMSQRSETPFGEDFLTQDAVNMNIQRACESCIDIANRVVRLRRLGTPKESRDSFVLLAEASIIDTPMQRTMIGMVGFRNPRPPNHASRNHHHTDGHHHTHIRGVGICAGHGAVAPAGAVGEKSFAVLPSRHGHTTPATCMPSGLGGHLPLRRCCCRAKAFRSGRRAVPPAYQMLSGTPVAAADCASLGHVTDSNAGAAMAAPALFPECVHT
jgi:uncharacterized protein YutE (UPF0331/DUF86 family)